MKTVVGVFPSQKEAKGVAHELQMMGISPDDVLVADGMYVSQSNQSPKESGWSGRTITAMATSGFGWMVAWMVPLIAKRSRRGAVTLGSIVGAAAGIIAGFISLAVSGNGPLVAGSAVATVVTALVCGAVAGALMATVFNMSVSHEMTPLREEAVREHAVVVAARVDEHTESGVLRVMSAHEARSLREGENTWVASGSTHRPPEGEELYPFDSAFKSHGELHW